MNLAFYVNDMSENELNDKIFKCLNDGIENKDITDASLFYNNPAYNGKQCKFGMFNSSDIWAYIGVLITTTLFNTEYANKIVNKFKLYYLYTRDEKNFFNLMDISNKTPVCVYNEEDRKEYYRLTGKEPKMIDFNVKNMMEILS